jgi:glutamyl-tRNA reductase
MNRVWLLGLNHTTAPLEVREKIAFTEEQARAAVKQLRERFTESEIVLLSTCNRVELYIARPVHGHPRAEEIAAFIAQFHAIEANQIAPHFYEKQGRDAVEHLFNVVSSLDSMVLGETQILGQVRQAYESANTIGAAGATLHPLFQRALSVGKQVHSQTSLSEGRVSIASAAVDYASQIFDHFGDKTLLCVGAGKMAHLVLKHFSALKPGRKLICNRDPSRAENLAGKFGGEVVLFESLADHLVHADIVITSTGATQPIITRQQFEKILKARRYKPIFLIDIAVPRDIEPSVGELDSAYLYNMDDLQKVVSATQSQRGDALNRAREIITKQVDEFLAWNRSREVGPSIDALYKRYHAVAREELDRTLNKLPNLSEVEREHLEELSRRLVNKLLHDPIKALRESDNTHGPTSAYLHALSKLFDLPEENQSDSTPDEPKSP